ncbi:MAG: class I SAM-dependent methyltransferase [Limisphaerales bacterium]
MSQLDYQAVKRYWDGAKPSLLGPYMMDRFGFPTGAGRFRFRAETKIVEELIGEMDTGGAVLDLGSGIGHWAEYFADRFARVVAVEGSDVFHEVLAMRAKANARITAVHGNVLEFESNEQFDLIFLGGLLMYLNDEDVIQLLQRLLPLLRAGGIVLCRESTVREGTETREGEYQATYRSVAVYEPLFQAGGLACVKRLDNTPYNLLQMGCESVARWKSVMPQRLQCLGVIGPLVYAGLRLGNPLVAKLPAWLRCDFPHLTNHFFRLKPESHTPRADYESSPLNHSILMPA